MMNATGSVENKIIVLGPNGRQDLRPDVVVLGPGGIKGYLELGALFNLEQEGYLYKVKTYCGVSVGSIISMLLVCGFTVKEIATHSLDIKAFEYDGISNFEQSEGIFKNEMMRKKLTTMITEKLCLTYVPTFHQLYTFTGKILVVVTTNRSDGCADFFSPEETPNENILNAVMGSINIPIVFSRVEINGKVQDDGAIGNCYPIDYFDNGRDVVFGIFVEHENDKSKSGVLHTIYNCICSIMRFHRNRIISCSSNKCYHIELFSDSIDTIGIASDITLKAEMISRGRAECEQFLNKLQRGEKIVLKSYKSPKKRSESKYLINK